MSEANPELAAKYQQAVQDVKALTATDNQKLAMYGYFKYVEIGKCNTERPTGWTDFVGKAKWDAWNEIDASLSKEQVMQKYIDLVESIKAAKA